MDFNVKLEMFSYFLLNINIRPFSKHLSPLSISILIEMYLPLYLYLLKQHFLHENERIKIKKDINESEEEKVAS